MLQLGADLGVMPVVVAEEFLQGADRTAGSEGDRFDALALEFGEQAPAVGVQVAEGLGVTATEQVRPKKSSRADPSPSNSSSVMALASLQGSS